MNEPRDAKRALLDAAAEEFARHGLHGVRVHAIVRRAGVNERMIYHHFGSKEGLYRAVLSDQWLNAGDDLKRMIARASRLEPREGLELAFRAMFNRFVDKPLMIPLAMHESMSGWKALPAATLAEVPAEIRELYARGQREGVFRTDCEFQTVYFTLVGALTSLTITAPRFSDVRKRARKDPAHLAVTAEKMIDLVLQGASRTNAPIKKDSRRPK